MRLAFARGCSLADWEATTGHDEWHLWRAFHQLYDLPDAYFTTLRLASLIASALGERKSAEAIVPFHAPTSPARARNPSLDAAFAWLKQHAPDKQQRRQPRDAPATL